MAGLLLSVVVAKVVMPKMMIVTRPSRLGFDETIERLSSNIDDARC